MTPDQVRDLLEQALTIYRHQRHPGAEHVGNVRTRGGQLVINFTDGTLATVTIDLTPPPPGA